VAELNDQLTASTFDSKMQPGVDKALNHCCREAGLDSLASPILQPKEKETLESLSLPTLVTGFAAQVCFCWRFYLSDDFIFLF
jgi:hypothetical protein